MNARAKIEGDQAVELEPGATGPAADVETEAVVVDLPAPAALQPAAPIAITAPHVLIAMNAVMAEIGITGIGKGRRNKEQGFDFRGIDDVYNELNAIMAKHKLLMLPVKMEPSYAEKVAKSGSILNLTRLVVTFNMMSAVDGTSQIVQTLGEGMDTVDKSSTKAQSSAMKYAALMVFMIPTLPAAPGDNDADETTHAMASMEEAAFHLLRGASADKAFFADAWTKNKDGWKAKLPPPAYNRLVAEMKRIAGTYPKDPPPAETQPRDERGERPRDETQQRREPDRQDDTRREDAQARREPLREPQEDTRREQRRDDNRDRADTRRPADTTTHRGDERHTHTRGAPPPDNFGIDDDEIPF